MVARSAARTPALTLATTAMATGTTKRGTRPEAVDGSSAPMRPISVVASCGSCDANRQYALLRFSDVQWGPRDAVTGAIPGRRISRGGFRPRPGSRDTLSRRARTRLAAFGDATCDVCLATCLDALFDRFGHERRIAGEGDSGVDK